MERKKCPKCGAGKLDKRVKRGLMVKIFLFWLPLKRYRCDNCYKKSYVFGSSVTSPKDHYLQAS